MQRGESRVATADTQDEKTACEANGLVSIRQPALGQEQSVHRDFLDASLCGFKVVTCKFMLLWSCHAALPLAADALGAVAKLPQVVLAAAALHWSCNVGAVGWYRLAGRCLVHRFGAEMPDRYLANSALYVPRQLKVTADKPSRYTRGTGQFGQLRVGAFPRRYVCADSICTSSALGT